MLLKAGPQAGQRFAGKAMKNEAGRDELHQNID
jgi:hypothetical protein